MAGKYIESDTFLMPLIPGSDRKARLVKETIRRHSLHGADDGEEAPRKGKREVMERVSEGERETYWREERSGARHHKELREKTKNKRKKLSDITSKRKKKC